MDRRELIKVGMASALAPALLVDSAKDNGLTYEKIERARDMEYVGECPTVRLINGRWQYMWYNDVLYAVNQNHPAMCYDDGKWQEVKFWEEQCLKA